jgi:molecular chaperone HtpG
MENSNLDTQNMEGNVENYQFSADVTQLMKLIINSIYSNKDVFIRELVSNSSDSLNKIRYLSLTDASSLDADPNLEIKVLFDRTKNILTIRDSGIGMTRDDLINNLGIIASSGTKKFLETLATSDNKDMIGKFGLGFYSSFLVSDNINVISKHNDDKQMLWASNGTGTFSIQEDETDYGLKRGTIINLHLKDDCLDYLQESKIIELIKKHNQFIDFKILIETQKTKEVEVEVEDIDEETADENKDDDTSKVATDDASSPDVVAPKTVTESYVEFDQINKTKPLWTQIPKNVSEEEYADFYKSISGDHDSHLDVAHFSVEGQVEFKSILYIPKKSPIDLFDGQTKRSGMVKLYSRKVFITDDCENLLPEYMKFIRGVVETDDLPLNISRETLQESKILKIIGKSIIKKALDMFNKIAENPDDFRIFYEQYSKSIKLGIHEDSTYRSKLSPLLRYETTNSNGDLISFDDYIENMKPEQTSIYYIIGESIASISNSPFLERLKAKNYEVIFMCDPLDEYVTQQVKDYKDKKLVCVTKENLELDEDDAEKAAFELAKVDFKSVCDFIKSTLSDEVEKVVVSNKLSESPCILSTSEFGWTSNMQRILKAQTFNKPEMNYMMGRKVLEINTNNSIIQKIKDKIDAEEIDSKLSDMVTLLYEVTLQSSGFTLEDPSKFSLKVLQLIDTSL